MSRERLPPRNDDAGPRSSDGESYELKDVVDMEQFMTEVDGIRTLIRQLKSHTAVLRDLHARALARATQPSPESATVTRRTTELSNQIRTQLVGLNMRNRKSPQRDQGFNVRRNHLEGLQNSFKAALEGLLMVEKDARLKFRDRVERQYRIVKQDATQEEIEEALAGSVQGKQVFAQALASTRQSGARSAFAEAQYRNDELRQIEKQITTLAQLMNDMASLVMEQDEPVQDIERNAVAAEEDTRQAHKQLKIGARFAAAARKKRWWCFFLCVVIVIILAVVLAVTLSP